AEDGRGRGTVDRLGKARGRAGGEPGRAGVTGGDRVRPDSECRDADRRGAAGQGALADLGGAVAEGDGARRRAARRGYGGRERHRLARRAGVQRGGERRGRGGPGGGIIRQRHDLLRQLIVANYDAGGVVHVRVERIDDQVLGRVDRSRIRG